MKYLKVVLVFLVVLIMFSACGKPPIPYAYKPMKSDQYQYHTVLYKANYDFECKIGSGTKIKKGDHLLPLIVDKKFKTFKSMSGFSSHEEYDFSEDAILFYLGVYADGHYYLNAHKDGNLNTYSEALFYHKASRENMMNVIGNTCSIIPGRPPFSIVVKNTKQ